MYRRFRDRLVTPGGAPSRRQWPLRAQGRYRLITAHASWLACEDFARFIHAGTSINDPGTKQAGIDWKAAISALDAGELPSPGEERRMPRLAASLADQALVSFGEAITGIDDRNVGLLVKAVLRASGRCQFPR